MPFQVRWGRAHLQLFLLPATEAEAAGRCLKENFKGAEHNSCNCRHQTGLRENASCCNSISRLCRLQTLGGSPI